MAVARALGISSSKPAGRRLELISTLRRSWVASTSRYSPSAGSGLTGSRPMSSATIRSARRIRPPTLTTESSARPRRTSPPGAFLVHRATLSPLSTALWPSPGGLVAFQDPIRYGVEHVSGLSAQAAMTAAFRGQGINLATLEGEGVILLQSVNIHGLAETLEKMAGDGDGKGIGGIPGALV